MMVRFTVGESYRYHDFFAKVKRYQNRKKERTEIVERIRKDPKDMLYSVREVE